MHFLMSVLVTACAAKSAAHVRVGGAALLEKLCKESAVELGEYHHTLLTMVSPTLTGTRTLTRTRTRTRTLTLTRALTRTRTLTLTLTRTLNPNPKQAISMLGAQSEHVLRAGHGALDTLVKSCAKERYPLLVPKMREQVAAVADEHRARCLAAGAPRGAPCLLPGFCLPKGLGPLQTVYLQGLMTGTPDLREAAAEALGEAIALTSNPNPNPNPDPNPNPNPEPDPNPNPKPSQAIELTSAEALKPFVIQITGPLIRIVGDRFAAPVNAAIPSPSPNPNPNRNPNPNPSPNPNQVKAAILGTLALLIDKGQARRKPAPEPEPEPEPER